MVAGGVILLGLIGLLIYRMVSNKSGNTGGCNPACGSHGTCVAKSKSCTCDPGWYGPACKQSSGGGGKTSPTPQGPSPAKPRRLLI